MAKRDIKVFYNVIKRTLQDEEGFSLASEYVEGITLNEQPMLYLQLVKDDENTAYTELSDSDLYSISLDNDFDQNTTLMLKTDNALINLDNSWHDGTTPLASQGKFSIPLDAYTQEFTDRIGTKNILTNTKLELKCIENGTSSFIFKVIFPFYCYNLQDNGGLIGPPAPIDYYNKTEIDSLLSGTDSSSYPPIAVIDGATTTPLASTVFDGYIDEKPDHLSTTVVKAGTKYTTTKDAISTLHEITTDTVISIGADGDFTVYADKDKVVGLGVDLSLIKKSTGFYYDIATGNLYEDGVAVEKCPLGQVTVSGGAITAVNSFYHGTKASVAINDGNDITINTTYNEDLPFYALDVFSMPKLYYGTEFLFGGDTLYISNARGVSSIISNNKFKIVTADTYLNSGSNVSVGELPPSSDLTSAKALAIINRGY